MDVVTAKTVLDAPTLSDIMRTPLTEIKAVDAHDAIKYILARETETAVDVARFMSSI